MIDHRLALVSIFAISLGLLVEEIMLSAIFNVLLGAGTTVAAIALVGLSASGLFAYVFPVFSDRSVRRSSLSRCSSGSQLPSWPARISSWQFRSITET